MTFCLGPEDNPILFAVAHLSLTKATQQAQLAFLANLVGGYEHVVLMGDFNVEPAGLKQRLLDPTGLQVHCDQTKTYPSWNPVKKLDYILTSPSLIVQNYEVLQVPYSDHLPVAMEVLLPEGVEL